MFRIKYIISSFLLFLFSFLNAQETKSLDEKINYIFDEYLGVFPAIIFKSISFSESVSVPWVLIVLILGALSFTVYFKFVNFRQFFTSIQIIRGKYDDLDKKEISESQKKEELEGEVSHFQALTAALSATVGLGNIAGVAVALSVGGPGATFWMVLAGLLGMSSKFVECTLGVKYREVDANGVVHGGPMYYLSKGIGGIGGKALAIVFSLMCILGSFGGGNMFQGNQAYTMIASRFVGSDYALVENGWMFGLLMAVLVGIVIIGGIKSIANVTDKIVPIMVTLYVMAGLVVLGVNYDKIPWAFGQIFEGAFSMKGIAGGMIGVMVQGFKRAAFSNEAGIGSAPIAHAAVKTKYAASEGLVALMEPFIDTVVICTMTALVLVVSGKLVVSPDVDFSGGVTLTSDALATGISWFPWVLTVAVVLFAFSTMISWSYYGVQAWTFLFGKSKISEYVYKFIFCVFVVIGCSVSMSSVIDFSDAAIFAMMIPNMIGMVFLLPVVRDELSKYLKAIRDR